MKPVIIIAIAFVLLIPTSAFAEIDIDSLFPNTNELNGKWNVLEMQGPEHEFMENSIIKGYTEEDEKFPDVVTVAISELDTAQSAKLFYEIIAKSISEKNDETIEDWKETESVIPLETCYGVSYYKSTYYFAELVCIKTDYVILVNVDSGKASPQLAELFDFVQSAEDIANSFLVLILDKFPVEILDIDAGSSVESAKKIPSWVKSIFLWYGQDQVSEDELLNAIKYLINEKILVVN